MNFPNEIKSSVYNPAFYAEKRTAAGGKAFSYFMKISTIKVLIWTIFLSFYVVPLVSGIFSQKGMETIVGSFPSDLQITIKGGQLSTNVVEPYYIPLPTDLSTSANSKTSSHQPKNLAVIDTKATSPLDSFAQYDTSILVTKDYLISQKSTGQVTVQKLSSLPDTVINQAKISDWITKLHPFLLIFIPLMIIGIIIGAFIFTVIGNLIFLLIYSLVVWLVQKIRKTGMTYGQSYKLGFYAITLPLALDLVFGLCSFYLPWYVDAVVFLVVIFVNIRGIKAVQPVS